MGETVISRREFNTLTGLGLGGLVTGAATDLIAAERPIGKLAKGKPVLDHIVWAVPDLEQGRAYFEDLTGVASVSGGKAPGRDKSHNALAALGNGAYFEIFSPVIGMKGDNWHHLVQDGKPKLVSYCLRVEDEFDALQRNAVNAGFKHDTPYAMGRVRPDGNQLNWKLLNISGSGVDNSLPFFIDWLGSKPHPSEDSPAGVTLTRFEVGHPNAAEVTRVFKALDIDLPVVSAKTLSFAAHLETPKGTVVLTS